MTGPYTVKNVFVRHFPFRVTPLVEEITKAIWNGEEDARLEWGEDRRSVRVLADRFIKGRLKKTQEHRLGEFRELLEKRLRWDGWQRVQGESDFYHFAIYVAPIFPRAKPKPQTAARSKRSKA